MSGPRPDGAPVIELHDVVKEYVTDAGPFRALDGVSLRIDAGELVAIVGRSGSGKSTLLNMITAIDRPTSGEVWVAGTELGRLGERRTPRWRGLTVGVVFQFFQLLPTLTVLENVMLGAQQHPGEQLLAGLLRPAAVRRAEQRLRDEAMRWLEFTTLAPLARG